ncbi:putative late blight resistance protein homolog R1A-3 [Solanum stenotomum]|uniref:putative late blight resistance protein homolog R1A-3 n=1 Tax=Solanum stenotomum TaxID=172797 RepID=UPI0020D159BD|nr:putative late blight resistance protein homolog R1A-3 [Solanum stenotomum]
MAENEIEEMLDHLRRIKSGGNLDSVKIDEIERLEMALKFLRTFIKYHHVLFRDSIVKHKRNAKLTMAKLHRVLDGIPDECKTNLNLERLESHLLEFLERNTILSYNYELNDFDMSECMDCVGKNLNDVLLFCLECVRSDHPEENHEIHRFTKELKVVQKKLRFLTYLYATKINVYVNHEKLECLETRIQFMANNVGHFCLAISDVVNDIDDDDDEDMYNDILKTPPYLLFLIVLVELEMKKIFLNELKASKFTHSRTFKDKKLPKGFSHHLHKLLMYLRKEKLENFPDDVSAQNIDVAIEFLLVFLDADVSNHVINGNWLNEVMEKVGAIADDVLYVIQKLLPSSINKDDTRKLSLCSIQILEKTKDLKAQVETYYKSLKFTPSQFPTVGGLNFLDSLIRKLNGMSKSESDLDFLMKPLLGNLEKELSALTSILEKDLSSLSSIFRDVAKMHHEHEILQDLHRHTINWAYEAEVAIDSILAQYNVFWHIFCSLPTILKEIKQINVQVTQMWSADIALKPCYVVAPFEHLPTRHINPVIDEEIVGFGNDTEKMLQYLIRGTNELDIIPIVGMGGQGKTTIARKVYNSDTIVSHFDVRAWCIVSQTYNRGKLLREIFSQVTGSKDKEDKDDILADELRKSLMGKRYLIVLDDMWDCMAWDDLRLSFPDFGNRSRIVVTTRLEKVGEQVKYNTDPYSLPFLTTEESCQLLQKKVFPEEDCPPELQDVSQAVAEKCKGLPLVIVLVAGIIKKRKMEESWWNEVKDALFDCLDRESEEYSLVTMQLSFDNLPDYLKPCLLYMGMFSEDARIPASKLISLWIAEGFVENTESAEDYLMDLISSNVVMVSKKEYNGKVKYCQVHDVVLHFCLEKSRKEKFMLAVKGNRSQFQPCDWKEHRVRFNQTRNPKHRSLVNGRIVQEHFNFASLRSKTWKPCDWKESRPNPKHGNLVIGRKVKEHSKFASLGSKTRKPFHQQLRSLITNGEYFDGIPFFQVHKLRLLKVLDLSSHRVYKLSASFKPLIHLKYLAVFAIKFDFHPESHMPHLETLIVNNDWENIVVLPTSFWEMEKLRYVEIEYAEFDKQGVIEGTSKLENLRILKNIFRFPIDSVDVLSRRCPNLQQLHIRFGDDNCSAESFCLTLKNLSQLQKLRLTSKWRRTVFGLQLPSNLKMLVLSGTDIGSLIAGLQSLEYLQLQDVYFPPSEEWCLGDITFPKLKVLKLAASHILRWDISEESFPLLETLVIRGCKNLEEIPLSFADIPTLKQIKLIDCNKSLEDSAERIKKDVEENEGNDRIDLIIENYN